MFAVIKTGGKQYKVAADNRITVMSLEGDAGARVTFAEVLALFDGETSQIGAPFVAGASVVGEIVEQTRGAKVIAFVKQLPDGMFETNRISVGRDGLTPPM